MAEKYEIGIYTIGHDAAEVVVDVDEDELNGIIKLQQALSGEGWDVEVTQIVD